MNFQFNAKSASVRLVNQDVDADIAIPLSASVDSAEALEGFALRFLEPEGLRELARYAWSAYAAADPDLQRWQFIATYEGETLVSQEVDLFDYIEDINDDNFEEVIDLAIQYSEDVKAYALSVCPDTLSVETITERIHGGPRGYRLGVRIVDGQGNEVAYCDMVLDGTGTGNEDGLQWYSNTIDVSGFDPEVEESHLRGLFRKEADLEKELLDYQLETYDATTEEVLTK